ncbi:hypothetical protein [Metabacillus malikii]|uniref:Ribosomal protein L37AE/L43A n=1 Tax=Metabacillus malikii TaxID=1504265 RepID=A0ABT9ZI44_9BACI|nr:hypothetical protein [Metabacillus malikii]MDQ0231956.1 ribosomal protein L37AE/L43A [Metabacillus malikii]
MYKKICYRCSQTSYSSTRIDNWYCPYCQLDLTSTKGAAVNHTLNVESIMSRLERQRGIKIYQNYQVR